MMAMANESRARQPCTGVRELTMAAWSAKDQLETWTSMFLLVFRLKKPSLDLGVAALEFSGPKQWF